MSKGDKNRTSDREAYRESIERIMHNENTERIRSMEAKRLDDEKWMGLAKYLKWIQGDDDEST